MKSNQAQKNSNVKQKVTAVLVVLIFVFIIYEVVDMFRGSGGGSSPAPVVAQAKPGQVASPSMPTPKQAQLPKQPVLSSQDELQLIQMQQETQAKYITALNELQMLRLQRDIAQTNQAIVSAKLATVAAQKNIVNMLSPTESAASQSSYANRLSNQPATQQAAPPPPPQPTVTQTNYSVISVMQLNNRWSAVLGYQGNLYSIHVGDVLPPDGSKVVSIDRGGVILSMNGVKRRISLVPII